METEVKDSVEASTTQESPQQDGVNAPVEEQLLADGSSPEAPKVPVSRLNEVIHERNAAKDEIAKLRAEVDEIKKQANPGQKTYTADELKGYRRQYIMDAKAAAESGDYAKQAELIDRAYQVQDMITEQLTEEKATRKVQEVQARHAEQSDMQRLESEHPELLDASSPLYREATRLLNERPHLTSRDAVEIAVSRVKLSPQRERFVPKGMVGVGASQPQQMSRLTSEEDRIRANFGLTTEQYLRGKERR